MLAPSDVVRVGASGLRTRPLRVVLSALGIAIGIAAMMAVVGISASSREDLRRQLDALGTNLLTVGPGQSFFGDASHLPDSAVAMVGRIAPVTSVTATGRVTGSRVYRNDKIPAAQSGGIAVMAARTNLLSTVGATLHTGTWLNDATAKYPAVVLGSRGPARAGYERGRPDGVAGRALVQRGRNPRPGRARPRTGHRGADRLVGGDL